VDGVAVARFPELQRIVTSSEGRQLRLGIVRNGQPMEIIASAALDGTLQMQRARPRPHFAWASCPRYEPLPFPRAFVRAGQSDVVDHSAHDRLSGRAAGRSGEHERAERSLGIAKAAGDWAAVAS
jgi:hypothetical protein